MSRKGYYKYLVKISGFYDNFSLNYKKSKIENNINTILCFYFLTVLIWIIIREIKR